MSYVRAIAGEQSLVEDAGDRAIAKCKEFDFNAAKRELDNQELRELKFDEAKADLAFQRSRVARLEALHRFLVERAPGNQFPGQDNKAWRVTAATNRTITIDNREIRWAVLMENQTGQVRLFTLIKTLVWDDAKVNLALRARADMRLNAAFFLNQFMRGLGSTVILDMENSLRERAIKDLASLEDEAERLLGPLEE